ncbi:MAG: ABC transporter permease, partial [Stellaceae bacterium]
MTIAPIGLETESLARRERGALREAVRRHPTVAIGLAILIFMLALALLAPYLGTVDPQALSPIRRLRFPSAANWFGTDNFGRDIYSRVIYGAQISLWVGFWVAFFSTAIGLVIGLVTGFSRPVDAVVMRIMDGLMSIPPVLLAIALMALTRASTGNVILSITVSQVPQVTRVVRGVVLSLR